MLAPQMVWLVTPQTEGVHVQRNHRWAVVLGAFAVMLAVVPPASAGNDFSTTTSTAAGVSTWDSDMINIEQVSQTGKGTYVAVLDTGLVPNWQDYFPKQRIATKLGKGFVQNVSFKAKQDVCGVGVEVGDLRETGYIGSSSSTHGTHVTSTIIGYNYRSNTDAAQGYVLPPIQVRGIAPEATIIPVKVLADYQLPSLPQCDYPSQSATINFGTSEMVAAGIDYVTSLANKGYRPMVINMSLGASGEDISAVERAAIDRAISAGVIVVASAGNEGEDGMGSPGNYAPVISAGSVGWTGEWVTPGTVPGGPAPDRYRMWWLQGEGLSSSILPGTGDVPERGSGLQNVTYLSDFSSRALQGASYPQQLDVLAPGSWVRGPFPGDPGYNHLPWWSNGIADLVGNNAGNFYYVGGTSMAAPHVASLSALALQKDPGLGQAAVESALKSSAMPLPATGSNIVSNGSVPAAWETISWDTTCGPYSCDPVGAGLIQADLLLN